MQGYGALSVGAQFMRTIKGRDESGPDKKGPQLIIMRRFLESGP